MFKKKSLFEKLTGGMKMDEENDLGMEEEKGLSLDGGNNWMEEDNEEGQLSVDVYQNPTEIIIQTMVAGVKPEDLNINITRDMVTIKGKREKTKVVESDDYFVKELYWGSFSRTILLPQEVEPEEAEAVEKHGLLIIKIPKIDKEKKTTLKIKSI